MNTCTWPEKSNIKNITLKFFQKFSDENPKDIIVICENDTINEFFEKLLKVNPTWWGMMKKIWPDSSHILIEIHYEDNKVARISIYNSRLQAADTSFYTDKEVIETSTEFVRFIQDLWNQK